MSDGTPREVMFQRDRLVVLSGLVALTILAWAYVGYMAWEMGHMADMAMPRMQAWG